MDTHTHKDNREWSVLCHNIRGINSNRKCSTIKNKIQEISCDIICLQENKRDNFDNVYLRKFTLRSFDCFCFLPLVGNSGGSPISWKGSKFQGHVVFENDFAQSVEFMSKLTSQKWILTNIYAPCLPERKLDFLRWFKNIIMPNERPWLIVGDFNLFRRPENRNKPGGDPSMMKAFNEAISKLEVIELPLAGQQYTWSNM
jgi:exonuclease III